MEKKLKVTDRSKDKFFSLIRIFEKSELPQKAFCSAHHVAYSTFQYWLKKYRNQKNAPASFVEIKIPAKKNGVSSIEIIFPSGAKILCDGHSDISLVRSLIL